MSVHSQLHRALKYVEEQKFAVFPLWGVTADGTCECGNKTCKAVGKHPIADCAPRGFKDATLDAAQVREWWTAYPTANIGIATGAPSGGVIVIDSDDKGGRNGVATFNELRSAHEPFKTYTVTTGSKGKHFYYRSPIRIQCSTSKIAPNVDVKGDGGYVVAAGGRNASGEYVADNDEPIAPLPEWLRDLIQRPPQKKASGEAEPSAPIVEGGRHTTLTRMAGHARRGGLTAEAIRTALLHENRTRCHPPLDDDEVIRIANDIGAKPTSDSPPTPQRTIRLISDEELATSRPPEFLVPGLFLRDSLAELYGPEGTGKTTIALGLAYAVASGSPFIGRPLGVCGPVVYVRGEGAAGLGTRARAWKAEYQALSALPVHFTADAVNLFDSGETEALVELISPLQPLLVIVDTLNRCSTGADENSARDMGLVGRNADLLRRATGALILLIHHSSKNGQSERGSNVIRCAADTHIRVSADRTKTLLNLTCEKQRDAAPFDTVSLRLTEITLLFKGAFHTACVVRPMCVVDALTANAQEILKLLGTYGGEAPKASIRTQFMEGGRSRSAYYRALDELSHSLIKVTGKTIRLLKPGGTER